MIDRWLWMWNYRKPIIAQVHGYCLSGGLDLIGACDIVWAAEGTLFGHPAGTRHGHPGDRSGWCREDRRGGDEGVPVHRRPARRRGGPRPRADPPRAARRRARRAGGGVLPAHRAQPARHPQRAQARHQPDLGDHGRPPRRVRGRRVRRHRPPDPVVRRVRPAGRTTTGCAPRSPGATAPYATGPAADHDAAARRKNA